jgi:hypothetical protein
MSRSELRELAHRSSAGVDVTLYWYPTLDELIVSVRDTRHGAHFEIRPQRYLALEVYYHPYAYADLEDVYEKENRRAAVSSCSHPSSTNETDPTSRR